MSLSKPKADEKRETNLFRVRLGTNPNNFMVWYQDIIVSILAEAGLAHGKAVQKMEYDPEVNDIEYVTGVFKMKRDDIEFVETLNERGETVRRKDEIDLKVLMTQLEQAIKAVQEFQLGKGKVMGLILSTLSASSTTRCKA